jgi:hypothetical protein
MGYLGQERSDFTWSRTSLHLLSSCTIRHMNLKAGQTVLIFVFSLGTGTKPRYYIIISCIKHSRRSVDLKARERKRIVPQYHARGWYPADPELLNKIWASLCHIPLRSWPCLQLTTTDRKPANADLDSILNQTRNTSPSIPKCRPSNTVRRVLLVAIYRWR